MLLWSVTKRRIFFLDLRAAYTFKFPLILIQGRNGLTHQQMLTVMIQLNSEFDIQSLGLELDVDANMMDAILNNRKGDIREAAYETLKKWRKEYLMYTQH